MMQGYTGLVQKMFTSPIGRGLEFDVGPDGRYYLLGAIGESDLALRNAIGFEIWQEASAIAKSFGYILSWEA